MSVFLTFTAAMILHFLPFSAQCTNKILEMSKKDLAHSPDNLPPLNCRCLYGTRSEHALWLCMPLNRSQVAKEPAIDSGVSQLISATISKLV